MINSSNIPQSHPTLHPVKGTRSVIMSPHMKKTLNAMKLPAQTLCISYLPHSLPFSPNMWKQVLPDRKKKKGQTHHPAQRPHWWHNDSEVRAKPAGCIVRSKLSANCSIPRRRPQLRLAMPIDLASPRHVM